MSKFLSNKYAALTPYVPGEQPKDMQDIKLNTTESPFPPSQSVIDAVNSGEVAKLYLYPDPVCSVLKQKLAGLYGVKSENVFVSNGSDDILNFAFLAFGRENGAVFPDITYGFYSVFADLNNIPYEILILEICVPHGV